LSRALACYAAVTLTVIGLDLATKLAVSEGWLATASVQNPTPFAAWVFPVYLLGGPIAALAAHRFLIAPVAIGLLVGGTMANLIDHQLDGSVTDFLRLPLDGQTVAYTNLADLAIWATFLLAALELRRLAASQQ
jgi:lipoprotein signal peptidase